MGSQITLVKRSHAFAVDAGLLSLLVTNTATDSTICSQSQGSDGDENLMSVSFVSDKGVSPVRTSAKLRVASLDLVIDPHFLLGLMGFWKLEDSGLDLSKAARWVDVLRVLLSRA